MRPNRTEKRRFLATYALENQKPVFWPMFPQKRTKKLGFSAYREEKASAKQRDEGAPYAPTLPSKAAISFCTLCSRFVPSTRSLIWRMAERPLPIAQLTPTRRSSS